MSMNHNRKTVKYTLPNDTEPALSDQFGVKLPDAPPRSPLGKLHKWWLREFQSHTEMMIDCDSYAGTPHGKAVIELIDRRLIKFVEGFEGAGVVELTPEGVKVKEAMEN